MLIQILFVLILLSWAYWLIAAWFVSCFFRAAGRGAIGAGYRPPVSLLKPVKGLDACAYDNFATFCCQDYPAFELVFAVADADDPAVEVIRRLQGDFPDLRIRLVVAPTQSTNPKAGLLEVLATAAEHTLLVVSDSDMRVTPDYLERVVAPLQDPGVGTRDLPLPWRERRDPDCAA